MSFDGELFVVIKYVGCIWGLVGMALYRAPTRGTVFDALCYFSQLSLSAGLPYSTSSINLPSSRTVVQRHSFRSHARCAGAHVR